MVFYPVIYIWGPFNLQPWNQDPHNLKLKHADPGFVAVAHLTPWMISCWRFFWAAMAVMPSELKVKTLEGGDLMFEVMPTTTIKELKAMLHEQKHGQDPIERQISRVQVLADKLLVDDDQTVQSAGLLRAESEVTAIFGRNEVEAAAKEAIHEEGLLQVNIPPSLTEIRAGAFEDYHQVVTVAIPKSVTVIGHRAFAGCKYLASITIPESVTTIGDFAFAVCKSLTSIAIPETVTFIGHHAFAHCDSLVSIRIPESVTSIEEGAFKNCSSLARITIPQSVTAIGDGAFRQCRSLASITIPESVTAIGGTAFLWCSSLASIRIPESVTTIGESAFRGCESLTSITIPETVTFIGHHAFAHCDSLVSIRIPESVTSIEEGAFQGCSLLANITIPDSVTTIRHRAFLDCSSLVSITIPQPVMIGDYAFDEKLQVERRHVWPWPYRSLQLLKSPFFFPRFFWIPFSRAAGFVVINFPSIKRASPKTASGLGNPTQQILKCAPRPVFSFQREKIILGKNFWRKTNPLICPDGSADGQP